MQPARAFAWNTENIPWGEPTSDGTQYALLEGTRDIQGTAFTYAFFIPAGFWDAPHWHSQDARVVVLSGALHLGYGDHLEVNAASIYPAGSYLLVPALARHFDGSDVDTVIIGSAVGVWNTHYVDGSVPPSAGTV